jgi:hypothetical protein
MIPRLGGVEGRRGAKVSEKSERKERAKKRRKKRRSYRKVARKRERKEERKKERKGGRRTTVLVSVCVWEGGCGTCKCDYDRCRNLGVAI